MKNKWYQMKSKGKVGNVRIFDEIGFFGVSAEDFFNDLDNLGDVEEINLSLNSPGGSMTEGNAMYNALRRHKAKVNVTVEGIAASMASVIAMAGDTVTMPENSFLMIHNPMVFMGGGADDLRKEADVLDKMKKGALNAYSRKAKISKDEISKLMDAETWMTAEEALEMGFADSIEGAIEAPETEEMKIDKHDFKCIPEPAMCFFRDAKAVDPETPTEEENPEGSEGEDGEVEEEQVVVEPTDLDKDSIPEPNNQGDETMDLKELVGKTLMARNKITKGVEQHLELASRKLSEDKIKELKATLLGNVDTQLNDCEPENLDSIADQVILAAKVAVSDEVLKLVDVIPPKTKYVSVDKEDQEKFVEASTVALMHGCRLPVEEKKLEEVRKAGYLGMGLQGYCRELLLRNGVSRAASMTPGQVYDSMCAIKPMMAASQGSGDFANAFEDVANKSLQNAWTNTPTTYEPWTGKGSIPDFRQKNIVRVTELGDIEEIKEGEAFPFTATNDSKEVATLINVGVAYGLTRKAIINDDLNALTDIPTKLGRSLQRYINRKVYTTFYGTSMVGPTMNEDSAAMFSSGHNNFVDNGSGGAPTATTLSVLRRMLMKQTMPTPDGSQSKSIYTRAMPKFIIYHTDLDQVIEGLLAPKYLLTGTADVAHTRDFITKLIGISDPVLDELMDAATDPHKGYYLIADPIDAGLISVYNLTGNESPTMRRKVSDVAEPLGTTWDIYYDVAVGAVDFRGGAANYGE